MRRGKFKDWWNKMRKPSAEKQNENFHKWLSFACRTVALRGDMHQQRVVYTIFQRYHKSKYRKLSRANAQKVWKIINQKTENLPAAPRKQERNHPPTPVVITKKRITRTIASAGSGRQKTDRPGDN